MHKHRHTHAHVHRHSLTHAQTHAHTHTHKHACIHTHINAYTLAHTHKQMKTCTIEQTQKRTHWQMYTNTQIWTYTLARSCRTPCFCCFGVGGCKRLPVREDHSLTPSPRFSFYLPLIFPVSMLRCPSCIPFICPQSTLSLSIC